jgi:hypothetical protein
MTTNNMDAAVVVTSRGAWGRTAVGTSKVYLYDADTRQEIPTPGLAWLGTSEFGIKDGVRYRGTALSIDAVRFDTREFVRITARPCRRIAVKVWSPLAIEWRLLVATEDGWKGNEADDGTVPVRDIRRNGRTS